jgi:hypothetical protein
MNIETKIEGRYTPKINTSKDISVLSYLNASDIKISDKNNSANNNTSLSKEVFSPVLLKANQSALKDVKTMKDIKQIADSKN